MIRTSEDLHAAFGEDPPISAEQLRAGPALLVSGDSQQAVVITRLDVGPFGARPLARYVKLPASALFPDPPTARSVSYHLVQPRGDLGGEPIYFAQDEDAEAEAAAKQAIWITFPSTTPPQGTVPLVAPSPVEFRRGRAVSPSSTIVTVVRRYGALVLLRAEQPPWRVDSSDSRTGRLLATLVGIRVKVLGREFGDAFRVICVQARLREDSSTYETNGAPSRRILPAGLRVWCSAGDEEWVLCHDGSVPRDVLDFAQPEGGWPELGGPRHGGAAGVLNGARPTR